MRIGILSMQRVKNHGSFLQAYALKKVIEQYGNDVKFVDFPLRPVTGISSLRRNKLYGYLHDLAKRVMLTASKNGEEYKLIFKDQKNFHRIYYRQLGISKYDFSTDVDVLVIGSDEVFNLAQYIRRGYEAPFMLFGEGVQAKKLISYAASCGNTTMNDLVRFGLSEKCKQLLRKFDTVSVRDENTRNVVTLLTEREPLLHIDPVLLYDFRDVVIPKPEQTCYVLIYAYNFRIGKREEIESIKAFTQNEKMLSLCVNTMQTFCDQKTIDSPFALMGYFQHAEYVITDTFHGVILSIKYNKKFAVFIRWDDKHSNSQKLSYLLQQFNLEDRRINSPSDLSRILKTPINYSIINEKLERMQVSAMEYLKSHTG